MQSSELRIKKYIAATHQIDTITPTLATERFQVPDCYACSSTAENGVMVRINYRDTVYQYIPEICNLDTADGVI